MGYIIENNVLKKYTEEPGVTEAVIPDWVTSIDYGAFQFCSNLTSVVIPDSVKSIGLQAFLGCKNLKYVTIPDSIENIGLKAFEFTPFSENDKREVIIYGKVLYKYKGENCVFTIPDNITCIGGCSFSQNEKLTAVIFHDKIIKIGMGAFEVCKSLESIDLPDGLTDIGSGAFDRCESLTEITIPESVKRVGCGSFRECRKLTKVTICGGDTVFEYDRNMGGTFKNCQSLKNIIFKSNIPEIPKKVFGDIGCFPEILLCSVPIKEWKDKDGLSKVQAAVGFMNAYISGIEFVEDIIDANKKWIRSNKKKLLDIVSEQKQAIIYMYHENILDRDDIHYIKDMTADNSEIRDIFTACKPD